VRREPLQNGKSAGDVCEGWQVMVHSPLDDAETFDIVDTADGQSFLAAVGAAGGGLVNPHRGRQGERKPLLDAGGLPLPVLTRGLVSAAGLGVVVNGRFWEQLVLPTAALAWEQKRMVAESARPDRTDLRATQTPLWTIR